MKGCCLCVLAQEVRAWQQYQHLVEKWGWRLTLTAALPAAPAAAAAVAPTAQGAGGVSMGVCQAAVLQQVPVLCGVSLGAVDLQVGPSVFSR